jgi:excisionase family DNA binding protein
MGLSWRLEAEGSDGSALHLAPETEQEMKEGKAFYTTIEAAHKTGTSPSTISRWCRENLIRSVKYGPSKQAARRIPVEELDRLLTEGMSK